MFQYTAELGNIHVALAASNHQGTVVLEVAAPVNYLSVGPLRGIPAHLFVRHPVEVGAQVDAGLVGVFVHERLLLEIPDGLFHAGLVSYQAVATAPHIDPRLKSPTSEEMSSHWGRFRSYLVLRELEFPQV